eukprot:scaffold10195_cov103-Skeletonema_marinoi.AAC.2
MPLQMPRRARTVVLTRTLGQLSYFQEIEGNELGRNSTRVQLVPSPTLVELAYLVNFSDFVPADAVIGIGEAVELILDPNALQLTSTTARVM